MTYQEIRKIGEGTYGVVYLAQNTNGNLVALKKIRLEDDEEGIPSTAIREISLLMSAEHPNVVRLYSVHSTNNRLTLAFEYVDYDLKKYMDRKRGALQPSEIKSFMHQLCVGLDFCHRRRIMHRDLKPQNLLVDNHGRLKIADFGLARAFQFPLPPYTHEIVTLWYRSPSILLGLRKYTMSVDIWSAGAIFGEMINKRPLFPGDSEIDQLFRIFRICGTPSDETWERVSELPDFSTQFPVWRAKSWSEVLPTMNVCGQDMMAAMMEYDPALRPSAHQLLQHPYFAGVNASMNANASRFGEMLRTYEHKGS